MTVETNPAPKKTRKPRAKGGFALVEVSNEGKTLTVIAAEMSSALECEGKLREIVHEAVANKQGLDADAEYGVIQVKRVGLRPKAEVKTTVTF